MKLKFRIWPLQDLHGKEKELLLNESKEKIATRENALAKAKQIKAELNINWISRFYLFILIFNFWYLYALYIYPNPIQTFWNKNYDSWEEYSVSKYKW